MACLGFLTGCFPCFMWRISVRTSCCALGLYFRPLDVLRELLLRLDFAELALFHELERLRELDRPREPVVRAELLRLLRPEDFLELDFFFAATCTST
jgi:hypothetical protein